MTNFVRRLTSIIVILFLGSDYNFTYFTYSTFIHTNTDRRERERLRNGNTVNLENHKTQKKNDWNWTNKGRNKKKWRIN